MMATVSASMKRGTVHERRGDNLFPIAGHVDRVDPARGSDTSGTG
jgi:hypothetical protein